jgi:hypothetical protein
MKSEKKALEREIGKLTSAEAFALSGARYGPSVGGYYFRLAVRSDVRRRLVERGYASKRIPNLLTAKGERVAAVLRARDGGSRNGH